MATNYPGSLDTGTQQPSPSASTEMDDAGFEHDVVHTNHSGAIIALETKVGTGSSTAAANSVLAGTGSGTSGWSTAPSLAGLTVDTDTLHVDATNDRVGIGTTTPETPLNIVTANKLGSTFTGTTDGEGLRVDQSDYTAGNYVSLVEASYDDGQTEPHVRIGAMFDGGGSHLAFGTSNNFGNGITNTAMFIAEDGKVGIGTTSPAEALDVAGNISLSGEIDGPSDFTVSNGQGEGIEFSQTDNATHLKTLGADRLTINSSGNVGIGTTSPSQTLDVRGIARVGDDTNRTPDGSGVGHLMIDGNGYGGYVSLDGAAMWVGHNASSRQLYLATRTDQLEEEEVADTVETSSEMTDLERLSQCFYLEKT